MNLTFLNYNVTLMAENSSTVAKGGYLMISKIISGGQTGVDRAALDFAIKEDIAYERVD